MGWRAGAMTAMATVPLVVVARTVGVVVRVTLETVAQAAAVVVTEVGA